MLLSFTFPNLHVFSGEPEHELWLVHRGDEPALTAEGRYERAEAGEAARALFGAWLEEDVATAFLDHVGRRDSLFEARAGLAPVSARTRLGELVRRGALVGLRRPRSGETDPERLAAAEERAVARELARLGRTVQLFPGRRCVLVAGSDYAAVPGRERYQVVRRGEAARLIEEAMAGPTTPGPVRQLLGKALALLTPDWRPPQAPKGLVLLRELPRAAAVGTPEAALTPSQLRTLIDTQNSVTLEVVVLGLDDRPLEGVSFVVGTPDDELHEGDLGASGKTKLTSVKKGSARVTLGWSAKPAGPS